MRNARRICLTLCLAAMLLFAAAAQGETISAQATYHSVVVGRNVSWRFDYSDSWFSKDADAYDHDVARASLGLALSSFRSKHGPANEFALAYLTDLGFESLKSEDYGSETSIKTIGTVMGHKRLSSGETLLAVGVCGQGYKNEWLSNFDIGDQQEHKGFTSAAKKVTARIKRYIADHQLTDVRLWIAGFSRAAAVTNLVGAELMEEGLFDEKNAFVYTFATPNTTRKPVAYANIFNVVGKFDPVSRVPYREWGFDRHGATFYTPAQETDSDYRQRLAAANAPFEALTGIPMWNHAVLNQHLAVIEAFLLYSIPTTADYDGTMRARIASAWEAPGVDAMLSILRGMKSISAGEQENARAWHDRINGLINYAANVFLNIDNQKLVDEQLYMDGKVTVGGSIMLEHAPEVYLAWMFSADDPEQVYSDKMGFVQLVVCGDADVAVFDQQGGFVLGVCADGELLETTDNERYLKRIRPVEDRPQITAVEIRDRRVFVLPQDQGFPFTMTACSDGDLEYYGMYRDIRNSTPTMSAFRVIHMQEGEEYIGFSLTPRGQAIMQADEPLWGDSHEIDREYELGERLTVSEAERLAGLNPYRVNVRTTVIVSCVVLGLALILTVAMLVFLLSLVIRAIRGARRMMKK